MTPKEVLAFAKEKGAKVVDIRFLESSGEYTAKKSTCQPGQVS